MKDVFIDVTQFQRHPSRTGIQRIIKAFACYDKLNSNNVTFIIHQKGAVYKIDRSRFTLCIESFWRNEIDSSQTNLRIWELITPISIEEIAGSIYLLPEVTYAEGHQEFFDRISYISSTVAIAFDLFPMSHPEYFADSGHRESSLYIRNLSKFDLVICISEYTRNSFMNIFQRETNVEVITLACDYDFRSNSSRRNVNQYIVVGTVEPRKNHLKVFEAFSLLNKRAKLNLDLVFIGRLGWIPKWQASYFREQLNVCDWFRWEYDASDNVLSDYFHNSNCLISIGIEGFGLPVFEARAAGCNVLYDGIQPAAELIESKHCIRVDSSNIEVFASEIEAAHETFLKQDFESESLKSWFEYIDEIYELINNRLG